MGIYEADLNQIKLYRLRAIAHSALKKFGAIHQMKKCEEELIELLAELQKFRKGQGNEDDIVDEVADVAITIAQMAVLIGLEKTIERFKFKLERLDNIVSGIKPE
jgi:NTP pyrophosphatase (non-canonical NTP hydrolase)